MFLLFSLYFSSLNLKYLKLTKMDITRFAMKLFTCSYSNKAKTGDFAGGKHGLELDARKTNNEMTVLLTSRRWHIFVLIPKRPHNELYICFCQPWQ